MEFIWYHVEGHDNNDYPIAQNFENLQDAYEFYNKIKNWQDLDFFAEIFYTDHREYKIIKRIGW